MLTQGVGAARALGGEEWRPHNERLLGTSQPPHPSESHERLTTEQPRHIQFSINAPPFTHPLRAHDDDDAAAASYRTFTLFACKSICHIASWAAGFQIHA